VPRFQCPRTIRGTRKSESWEPRARDRVRGCGVRNSDVARPPSRKRRPARDDPSVVRVGTGSSLLATRRRPGARHGSDDPLTPPARPLTRHHHHRSRRPHHLYPSPATASGARRAPRRHARSALGCGAAAALTNVPVGPTRDFDVVRFGWWRGRLPGTYVLLLLLRRRRQHRSSRRGPSLSPTLALPHSRLQSPPGPGRGPPPLFPTSPSFSSPARAGGSARIIPATGSVA
jgi:hypothetical protein